MVEVDNLRSFRPDEYGLKGSHKAKSVVYL